MMRGLAEFIMRGRWQLSGSPSWDQGVCCLAGSVQQPLHWSPSKRNSRRRLAGLWALLPAVVITAMTGDTGSVMLLAGAFGLAVVLQETVNLSGRDGQRAIAVLVAWH